MQGNIILNEYFTIFIIRITCKMAYKRKGQLTTSPEWARHLRTYMKRLFWKGERKEEKRMIRNELANKD